MTVKLRTLTLTPGDAWEFRVEIVEASSLEDLLVAEARAGAAYFMPWRGKEIRFRDDAPQLWRVFTARASSTLHLKS